MTATVKMSVMGNRNEVPPPISSGLTRFKNFILCGLGVLTAVYVSLWWCFRDSTSTILPPPAEEFCIDQDPAKCSRSDLFAFQIASGLAITACGLIGFRTWNMNQRMSKVPSTPEGRLFGYLAEGEYLSAINLCFQIWDLLVSLLIPEHRTPIMITHHILASTVCWMSLGNQVLQYYAVFFVGVSEFSSIFLVFVDLARFFPPATGSLLDMWVGFVCGPIFAIFFTLYRVILWWPVSFQLWKDVYHVVRTGTADKLRPGKSYILYTFLAINLPLGILQLYWFTIILEEALKFLAI